MKSFLFLTGALFLLSACGSQEKKEEGPAFVSQTILIDDKTNPFPNDSVAIILEAVGLCDIKMDTTLPDSMQRPPCDPRLFRYFANQDQPFSNGFLVEIKPNVWSPYFLVVNIARNKDGDLYKSNAFHGQLLELRTTPEGPYDMIIRYVDTQVGTVAVLHQWRKTKYDPVDVVEINDRFVKPEKKDSLNAVYLQNFVWGY